MKKEISKSTAFGVIAALLITWILFLPLSTPDLFVDLMYGGTAISSLATIVLYFLEKRNESKASLTGLVILSAVVLLFILLAVILPLLAILVV